MSKLDENFEEIKQQIEEIVNVLQKESGNPMIEHFSNLFKLKVSSEGDRFFCRLMIEEECDINQILKMNAQNIEKVHSSQT